MQVWVLIELDIFSLPIFRLVTIAAFPYFTEINPTAPIKAEVAQKLENKTEMTLEHAKACAHNCARLHYGHSTIHICWIGDIDFEEW